MEALCTSIGDSAEDHNGCVTPIWHALRFRYVMVDLDAASSFNFASQWSFMASLTAFFQTSFFGGCSLIVWQAIFVEKTPHYNRPNVGV